MLKDKKKLIILIVIILALTVSALVYVFAIKPKTSDDNIKNNSSSNVSASNIKYILEGYPIDDVPLYDGVTISSMKYIVNEDSTNIYDDFFGAKRNYYNVVFEAKIDEKDEIFEFYESKMSSINEENNQDSTIEGVIGDYRVSISNYGYEDYYLQVHLPAANFSKENLYYEDYQELVEIASNWIEYENSYGLLNQKGGEIEYTQWFSIDVSEYEEDDPMRQNPVGEYYKQYKLKYADKQDFVADDETGRLTWSENDFEVTASFTVDHGRIYLMFRKPIE